MRLLSDISVYDETGQRLLESFGPLHTVKLEGGLSGSSGLPALQPGAQVSARRHVTQVFDEGRTTWNAVIRDVATTVNAGAYVEGYSASADLRTAKTSFN